MGRFADSFKLLLPWALQSIIARECLDDRFAHLVLRQMFNRSLFFVMMARWQTRLLDNCLEYEKPEKRDSFAATHWKPSLVRTGVVERLYMDHILATDPFVGAIKTWTGASYHALPEISLSQLKSRLSVVTLDTVDEISRQLALDDRPHAFLIGQLNHWIAIVSNRVARPPSLNDAQASLSSDKPRTNPSLIIQTEENDLYSTATLQSVGTPSNRFIETILLDSRNDFVLNMGPTEIAGRVDKRVKKEFKPNGSLWHDLCIKIYEQSLNDTQYSCDLFHALITSTDALKPAHKPEAKILGVASDEGSESEPKKRKSKRVAAGSKGDTSKPKVSEPHPITTELILLNVRGFFENFEKHVGDVIDINCQEDNGDWVKSLPTCDMADWVFKFQLYVQEYAPLRSIEDGFIGSLKNVKKRGYKVPPEVMNGLARWSLLLESRVQQARKEGVVQGDAEEIVEDLMENTIPWIATSIKYLKRK